MSKLILFHLIFTATLIFNVNAQEKCATQFNPNSLPQQQLDKLQLFNSRVQSLHQNQTDKNTQQNSLLLDNDDIILIPVVVHIVWNIASENLSVAQIQSQIDVLNEDFRRINTDASNTPVLFQDVAGDTNIQFYLACEDPNGNPTNGITRTQTTVTSFNPQNDNVKFSASGGKDAWNTARYLNIWVCDITGSTAGYAQFPEYYSTNPDTDGIVVDYVAFGRNSAHPTFNLGRTATHEVAHWAGLYHIWSKTGLAGNSSCVDTDEVADTPNQADANTGCPNFPESSCGNTSDMFMNYMDYSDDACMNLFTEGQKIRMRANFAPGGFRDYFQYQTISSYINGNDAVCPTAATYSINGLPTGAGNFNWEVGPRLEIVSGANTNNPQIKAKLSSHRDDWIIGSFTAGCYGRIYVR